MTTRIWIEVIKRDDDRNHARIDNIIMAGRTEEENTMREQGPGEGINWYVPRLLDGAAHVLEVPNIECMLVLMVGRRDVGEFFAGFGITDKRKPTSEQFGFFESWHYMETPYSTEAEAIRESYVKALAWAFDGAAPVE